MEEKSETQVTVYRWVMGIMVALILAGTGFVLNAITMSTNTKLDYLWQRLVGIENGMAESSKQLRAISERVGIIEWQQKQIIERRGKKENDGTQ